MKWMLAFALALALAPAGCYRPALEDACTVSCASGACPDGLICGADQLCHEPGRQTCTDDRRDASVDGVVVDNAPGCYGRDLVAGYCPPTVPTTHYAPADGTILLTDGSCQNPASDRYCIVMGQTVTIDGVVRATGSRPLVLIAATTLTISATGVLDVSSSGTSAPGAGAVSNMELCGSPTDGSVSADSAGSGGAGGTFKGVGGPGGDTGSAGGGTPSLVAIGGSPLRGGCPGTSGGNNGVSNGGAGGGAVVLIAGTTIEVRGSVRAWGAGGRGGGRAGGGGGGGGGGSGGLIALDAPTVRLEGSLLAGGGGGGGGGTSGGEGSPGQEMSPSGAAGMGGPSTMGGAGGSGGAVAMADMGQPGEGQSTVGAGGGGGGVGAIRIFGMLQDQDGTIRPAPTVLAP